MNIPLAAVLGAGVLLWAAAQTGQTSIRGFAPGALDKQKALEARARALPDTGRLRASLEQMASEPHAAGSPASKAVAEYAAGQLRDAGFDVRIERFEALLPYPTERRVEMIAPSKYRLKLQEPAIAEDKDSGDKGQLPTYNAYSGSGDVTGPLLYVNYGIPADYEELRKAGIDPKGKIVIARYGRSWRGTKAKVAEENGAVGCLIYSDPRDDGFFQGDPYPKGPFRPKDSAQRGSVIDMPIYPGDPLTPGWAGEPGGRKLARTEASTLLKIPVMPIAWSEAQELLENLDGAVVPEPWRGGLPLTYHFGPGPATVHMRTDFDWTVKPVYNVIATMTGSDYPNQWIIYGNHHDAWVNGANDPVSGAAVVLETGRVLGALKKSGWQPKRTIKLALWDAEEFGLVGSTEWVEKHEEELAAKAVAYLNSDSNSRGRIGAGGSLLLEKFFSEVLRDVNDPDTGKPLLSNVRASGENSVSFNRTSGAKEEPAKSEFPLGPLGAGSDYVAFYHHTGIASLNAGFSGPGSSGVYHSIYDSRDWYLRFMDPEMKYGRALTEVMTTSLVRLADSDLLPFDFAPLAPAVSRWMEEIRKGKGGGDLRFEPLLDELQQLKSSAERFEQAYEPERWSAASKQSLDRVNRSIYLTERAFAAAPGLEGRPWYRHRLAAPGLYTGYTAKTLPGVRENAEAGRREQASRELASLITALKAFRAQIDESTKLLSKPQ